MRELEEELLKARIAAAKAIGDVNTLKAMIQVSQATYSEDTMTRQTQKYVTSPVIRNSVENNPAVGPGLYYLFWLDGFQATWAFYGDDHFQKTLDDIDFSQSLNKDEKPTHWVKIESYPAREEEI